MVRSFERLDQLVATVVAATDYETSVNAMLEVNREVSEFLREASVAQVDETFWMAYQRAYEARKPAQAAWEIARELKWGPRNPANDAAAPR